MKSFMMWNLLLNIEYIKDDPQVKRLCRLEIISSHYTVILSLKYFTVEVLRSFALVKFRTP